ncbi:MAG TPA: NmrA family NAD(P)-binding protein, partial [Solirubrobacterales bacterium]|nr:NmrA family NAD(P)-binding protein [Solirubrobacterales bacterium]
MSTAGVGDAAPTYLIDGATGVIGRRLVAALRRDGVAVRALVRDAGRGRAILGPEVELFVA